MSEAMSYKLLLVLTAVVSLLVPVNGNAAENEIEWSTDVEGSLREAAASGKPAVLYFTASWCGYCRRMEKNTYTDAKVVETVNRNFVPVKIDSDRNRSLLKELGVKGLPEILVVSPELRPLKRISGFQTPEAMLASLPVIPTKRSAPAASQPTQRSRILGRVRGESADNRPGARTIPLPWPKRGVRAVSESTTEMLPTAAVASYGDPAAPQMLPEVSTATPDKATPDKATEDKAAEDKAVADNAAGVTQPAVKRRLFGDLFAKVAAERNRKSAVATTAGNEVVAFRGASLVTAVERRAVVRGSEQFQIRWRGHVLWFESEAQLRAFAANSELYWPMLNGLCPITLLRSGEQVQGELEYAALFRNRVWLFSSEADMREFLRDPAAVAAAVQ